MYIETWYKITCDQCASTNWVCNGDVSDQTVADVAGFRCWACKKEHRFGDEDDSSQDDDPYFDEGKATPS